MSNLPWQPHQKYNITQYGDLNWLFIPYSEKRSLYYKFSLPHSYIFSLIGWENVLFELRSERVNIRLVYSKSAAAIYP